MNTTRHALSLLAAVALLSSCKGKAPGPDELEATSAAPATPSTASAPAAPAAGGGQPVEAVAPTAACAQTATFGHDCWTEKFPPDISHNSDIGCRFTTTCCGTVVQKWERVYPEAAGPSGVVSHATRDIGIACDSPALSDLDGDGTPNADDPNPMAVGEALPWK